LQIGIGYIAVHFQLPAGTGLSPEFEVKEFASFARALSVESCHDAQWVWTSYYRKQDLAKVNTAGDGIGEKPVIEADTSFNEAMALAKSCAAFLSVGRRGEFLR